MSGFAREKEFSKSLCVCSLVPESDPGRAAVSMSKVTTAHHLPAYDSTNLLQVFPASKVFFKTEIQCLIFLLNEDVTTTHIY